MASELSNPDLRPDLDEFGRSPLHYAAAESDAAYVQLLLSAGAGPNERDDGGWTPRHFAAQAVSADVTDALLRSGANVDLRDSHGNTPLWRAVYSSCGDGSVIRLLRDAGADPRVANDRGVSPIKLSRRIANYDVAGFFADLLASD